MRSKTRFELALDSIRPKIIDYLVSKGYPREGPIRCINPEHEDKTPSMLIGQADRRGHTIWCESCHKSYDIFDTYAILEDTPRRGPDWIKRTVLPLANLFNIELPRIELSLEEQFVQDFYIVMEDVASLINHDINKMPAVARKYIEDKGWTYETLNALDIGTLSYDKVEKIVSEDDRKRFGLNRPDVFQEDGIIFTTRDRHEKAVRFHSRLPEQKPKFTSTSTTRLTVDIWRDQGILYLSHLINNKHSKVILVEGHPDATTLYQAGVENVVALGGSSSFSENHADALTLSGILEVIIAYDGDRAGQDGILKLLRQDFAKASGISYKVAVLPDGHDPDSYVKEHGSDAFSYLAFDASLSAFEFVLSKKDTSEGPQKICEDVIPFIASIKSEVARERMARSLMEFLDGEVTIGAILADVRRKDETVLSRNLEQKKTIVAAVNRQAGKSPDHAKEIYRDAVEQLDGVDKELAASTSKSTCLARINAQKAREEALQAGGYALGKGSLQSISDLLSGGDWFGKKVMVIAGVKNVGKSTMIDNFVWQAITNQENENTIAYLLTIDDPAEARFRRLCCISTRDLDFTQSMVSNPHEYESERPDVYEIREYGYSRLTEAVASGRLIIEDARDGTSLAYADKRLAQLRRDNPDAKIIFALDNFHDISDWGGTEIVDRIAKRIIYGKRICEFHDCLGLFSMQYRKLEYATRPGTDDDLSGSVQLGYATHLTMHMFSDYNVKGKDKALGVHFHNDEIMPRILVDIGKNKINDKVGPGLLCFDFYPASAQFRSVSLVQAIQDKKERREQLDRIKKAAEEKAKEAN